MRIRDQTPNGEGSRSRNIKKTRIQQAVDSKLCAHTHTHAHPLTSAAQIANASVKQKNPRTIYSTYKKTDSWKKFKRSGTGTNGGVSRATNTGREDLRGSKAFHSSTRRGNKRRNSQNTQPQCNVKQRRAYLAWQHMLKEKKNIQSTKLKPMGDVSLKRVFQSTIRILKCTMKGCRDNQWHTLFSHANTGSDCFLLLN